MLPTSRTRIFILLKGLCQKIPKLFLCQNCILKGFLFQISEFFNIYLKPSAEHIFHPPAVSRRGRLEVDGLRLRWISEGFELYLLPFPSLFPPLPPLSLPLPISPPPSSFYLSLAHITSLSHLDSFN